MAVLTILSVRGFVAWALKIQLTAENAEHAETFLNKNLDQQFITDAEFEDVYGHAGRTRATIRGFINYLVAYQQDQQKKSNLKPLNAKRWTFAP